MLLLSLLVLGILSLSCTETIEVNNQTFNVVPLSALINKVQFKTKNDEKFRALTSSTDKPVQDDTNTADSRIVEPEESPDVFECEIRLPVGVSGLADIEELLTKFEEQQKNCKVKYINGDRYEGQILHTSRTGKGIMHYANGEYYDGMWNEDKEEGSGMKIYRNGNIYTGMFKNNMRNGHGTMVQPSGDIYDGEYVNDLKHGEGTFYFTKGDVYTGGYHKGQRHGYGIYYFGHGIESYEGDWQFDVMQGKGIYVYPDGEMYEGEFVRGKREGRGAHRYSNGDTFDGYWAANKRSGSGIYKFKNGNVYEGDWLEDTQHGRGIFTWGHTKTIYVGKFERGQKHGQGLLKYQVGLEFLVEYDHNTLYSTSEAFTFTENVKYVPVVPPMQAQFKKPKPKMQFVKVEYVRP